MNIYQRRNSESEEWTLLIRNASEDNAIDVLYTNWQLGWEKYRVEKDSE